MLIKKTKDIIHEMDNLDIEWVDKETLRDWVIRLKNMGFDETFADVLLNRLDRDN